MRFDRSSPLRIAIAIAALAACSAPSSRDAPVKTSELAAAPAARAGATPADTDRTDLHSARSMGSASAPITVYEMSDFQCPFCRRHALETMPVLEREFVATGKVRWVFINFPITQLHPNALAAAEFGLCAARAGRFWQAHHLLFEHQSSWARLTDAAPFLLSLADSIGVARQEILPCLEDPAIAAAVKSEAEGSMRAGANSTPSFYIEGGLLVGAQPAEVFRPILDSIYAVRTRPRS